MENFTTDECTASCYTIVDATENRNYMVRGSIWNKEPEEDTADTEDSNYYRNEQDLTDEEPESIRWWNRSHNGILCGRQNEEGDITP
jgi:hypothetical protein